MSKFCTKCGHDISGQADQSFCENCGAPISQDPNPPENACVPPVQSPQPAPTAPVTPQPPVQVNKGNAKVSIPLIIVSAVAVLLLIFSILASVAVHSRNNEIEELTVECSDAEAELKTEKAKAENAVGETDSLYDEIDTKQAEIDDLNDEIDDLNAILEDLNEENLELSDKADQFDKILEIASSGRPGWASKRFHTDGGIFIMHVGDDEKMFELTFDHSETSTVTWDEEDTDIADVNCYEENLGDVVTPFYVAPYSPGVTSVTFSNSLDDETFTLVLIVLE